MSGEGDNLLSQNLLKVLNIFPTRQLDCFSISLEKFRQLYENLCCKICGKLFDNPAVVKCSHRFCKKCIEKKITLKQSCPICQESLPSKRGLRLDSSISPILNCVFKDFKILKNNLKAVKQKRTQTKIIAKELEKRQIKCQQKREREETHRNTLQQCENQPSKKKKDYFIETLQKIYPSTQESKKQQIKIEEGTQKISLGKVQKLIISNPRADIQKIYEENVKTPAKKKIFQPIWNVTKAKKINQRQKFKQKESNKKINEIQTKSSSYLSENKINLTTKPIQKQKLQIQRKKTFTKAQKVLVIVTKNNSQPQQQMEQSVNSLLNAQKSDISFRNSEQSQEINDPQKTDSAVKITLQAQTQPIDNDQRKLPDLKKNLVENFSIVINLKKLPTKTHSPCFPKLLPSRFLVSLNVKLEDIIRLIANKFNINIHRLHLTEIVKISVKGKDKNGEKKNQQRFMCPSTTIKDLFTQYWGSYEEVESYTMQNIIKQGVVNGEYFIKNVPQTDKTLYYWIDLQKMCKS